jgi:hypothetical protein
MHIRILEYTGIAFTGKFSPIFPQAGVGAPQAGVGGPFFFPEYNTTL